MQYELLWPEPVSGGAAVPRRTWFPRKAGAPCSDGPQAFGYLSLQGTVLLKWAAPELRPFTEF